MVRLEGVMRARSKLGRTVGAIALLGFSEACGGSSGLSAPPSQAPAEESAPAGQAREPESGEDELTRAQRELDDADARLSSAVTQSAAPMSDDAGYEEAAPADDTSRRCVTVCKAYASLLRARAAICRIDGEEGPRCERANFTVERHENSRAACDCPRE